MAKKTGVSIRQSVYKTFRGADFSTDPSLVDYSRSPLCTNIVADGGGMPQKRLGWRKLWQKDKPVYGLFAGRFDGTEKKLAHIGTALYPGTTRQRRRRYSQDCRRGAHAPRIWPGSSG